MCNCYILEIEYFDKTENETHQVKCITEIFKKLKSRKLHTVKNIKSFNIGIGNQSNNFKPEYAIYCLTPFELSILNIQSFKKL